MASFDPTIAFIGFGEAAKAFASGFRQESPMLTLKAYDRKTDGEQAADKRAEYKAAGIGDTDNIAEACHQADLVFSLVTADQAGAAAQAAAGEPLQNALFFDCNSCAPETKQRSSRVIEEAGGRYVDVAVMTPVHPKLHKSPCLIAGVHAKSAAEMMQALGMKVEIAGPKVGDASVRKMIRSVMIKGLEALTLESFLAARKAGIEDYLLQSLEGSFPGFDWERRAPYMIERAMTHGIRRAAEMEEVAQTVRDLGLTPHMSKAIVKRQREIGTLGLDAEKIGEADLAALTDAILRSQGIGDQQQDWSERNEKGL